MIDSLCHGSLKLWLFVNATDFPMQENAHLVYDGLKDVPGLHPIMPSGTMYMMVSLCTR